MVSRIILQQLPLQLGIEQSQIKAKIIGKTFLIHKKYPLLKIIACRYRYLKKNDAFKISGGSLPNIASFNPI